MDYPITQEMVRLNAESYQESEEKRHYLGMSEIGHECERKSWLSFRSTEKANFPPKTILKFEDGHRSEDITAERLKRIPSVELLTLDPATNEQWTYRCYGGHFKGHSDGVIIIDQGGEIPHTAVWEHKCTEQKYFNRLNKLITTGVDNPLEEWNYSYYAQAQLYMGYSGIHSHLMTVATSGSREYLEVWTKYDDDDFAELFAKAGRIIESQKAPEKIRDAPVYPCNACHHQELCHGQMVPKPSCKNCLYGSACISSGKWVCGRGGACPDIFVCGKHLYNPDFLASVALQFDHSEIGVIYDDKLTGEVLVNDVENGSELGATSQELYELFESRRKHEE